jgi:DeoR/GlpR family transcriptional regulator of sugar metabolism
VHGGAVRPAPDAAPRRYVDRLEQGVPSTAVVAGLAQRFVAPGRTVALGGGTTTLALARGLPLDLEATVVTTSPEVAVALRGHARVEVDLLGGRLHRDSQTVTGADTVEQLRALRPDVCVVSPCSLDPEVGVTLREREEAVVVRTMVERSARVVVAASADKLGAVGPYVVAPVAGVDALVTDAPRGDVAAYEALGIVVVTPDTPEAAASPAPGAAAVPVALPA